MACINGLPCLEIINDVLTYTAIDNHKHIFTICGDYSKDEIYTVINDDLFIHDRSLTTEDRIVFDKIIDTFKRNEEYYLTAQQAVSDVINSFEKLKMYVVVRSDIGIGHSVNCVGHATNKAEATWNEDLDYQRWKNYSFKKVTCKANRSKFEDLKKHGDYIVISEDVLNDVEVAIIFKPRAYWPEDFKRLRMFE